MFGGLDMKGSGGDDEKKTAAPTSAFGFMNSGPPAPAEEPASAADAAPASSGFSFLNAGPPAAAPEPAPAPASPPLSAMSGFSFMQDPTPAPAVSEEAAPAAAAPAAESGFSFMMPSSAIDEAPAMESPPELAPEPSTFTAPAPAPSSGFSFMSTAPPPAAEEPEMPVAAQATSNPDPTIESTPPSQPQKTPYVLDLSSTSMMGMSMPAAPAPSPSPAPASTLPAGAGITFGTAAKKPVTRKKKTRAQRVGVGAAAAVQSAPAPAPAVAAPAAAPSPSKETRDAAAEAQRRAEEFMHQKTKEEAKAATTTKLDIPTYDPAPAPVADIQPSPSTDEEVARAKRAAEEAQKMAGAAGVGNKKGGFMGTFFKGFGGSNSQATSKTSSKPGVPIRQSSMSSHGSSSGIDRLAKQQQEMKKAAAERHMQLQQQTPSLATASTDDDDDVVVSTSVGGYQPQALDIPATAAPSSSPSNTTVATSATTSILSTFEPAKPAAPAQPMIVVRELAPTPKKKKTPTMVFEEYQALFAQSVHRAMQQVEAVRSQQKMLLEERFVAMAKQRLSTQQIEQTEGQLQVAVEAEDYELADQLGQIVDAHNREKGEVASMLESIAKGLTQLESQKALVVQGVATCFDNLAVRIKDLQEQENSKDRDSDSETLKQFATISKQLSAEQERLQQDLKHLERDEKLVGEERSDLESSISEQSGEYERQRDGVKDTLSQVEEEILELRKQLDSKIKIAAGLRTEMHGLEDSISKVRVKFSRQLTRLDKKERSVSENRLEWDTEESAFKRQKEAHELQVQTHSEALLAHDALMKTLNSELQLCKEFEGMVSTKLGFFQDEIKTREEVGDAESEGDLAQLQADVVKCEVAVSEGKVLLKAATAAIANLEAEHATLIARVPQLENAKKAAAAKRDFKAASKASKEIKDSTARLKECEAELLGDAAEKKKAAEEELQTLNAQLTETRKIAQEKEKISGIAKMKALAKQVKQLLATKVELCGETTSSENTVKGVGAFVLDGQIKALKDEGETLGMKYGGWVDLMREIGEKVDADSTPEPEQSAEESAPAPAPAPAPALVDDGLTSEERIAKVRDLIKRIQQAEESLEAAAEREDYDEAAELQETFENLQMELENINLSEEETELAFADEEPSTEAETGTIDEEKAAGDEDESTVPIEVKATGDEDESTVPVAEKATSDEDKSSAPIEGVSKEEESLETPASDDKGTGEEAMESAVSDTPAEDSEEQAGENVAETELPDPDLKEEIVETSVEGESFMNGEVGEASEENGTEKIIDSTDTNQVSGPTESAEEPVTNPSPGDTDGGENQ